MEKIMKRSYVHLIEVPGMDRDKNAKNYWEFSKIDGIHEVSDSVSKWPC